MVATFSPHRDAGGTLHLPSPTGMHHVDATSAIRQLRRSLSRSPSKSADFRLLSSRSHQQTPNTPFVSSPLSPSRRAHHGNLFFLPVTTSHLSTTTTTTATPVAIPFPPSAKINRPVMRRAGSFQNTRTRTSPKSPSKRALNISSDHGNATSVPPSLILSGDDDKNCSAKANDVRENVHLADHDLSSSELNLNLTPNHPPVTRVEKRRSGNFGPLSSTASPLKRSDGIMNLDQAGFESPSAKRRSLHGASFASEFNIFDTYDNSQSTTEASDTMARDTDTQTICIPNSPASPFATIPKRSSSLRRSTLQQRQGDRSFAGRSRLMNVDYSDSPPTSPGAVMRHRMSLDGSLSVASSRDNPFASQSPGTPTGTSLFSSVQNAGGATPHGAHPLSRTMTQSSSSSSLADDSPTHEPIHKGERPKAVFNFSKSLPAGATRPGAGRQLSREDSTSSSDSFATPENYKLVKPLPAAFLSTGLISKKSRNAEDLQNPLNTSKNMPDTPCKRSTNFLPTAQKALPVRPLERPKLTRQSFAVPSTPFNPQHTRPAPGPFARGTSIFGSAFNRPEPSRRGSFVSVDGDEQSLSQSPSTRHGTHSIIDTDLPPTPTKQTFPGNNAFSGSLGGASLDLPAEHQASNDNLEIASPRTPKDSFFPPDPSGLSISAPNEAPLTAEDFNSSIITFPATPTGPREFFASGAKRPSLALDNHNALDVDPSLTSRFERVELIGTGEFSQVYRVSSPQDASQYKSIFSLPSSGTNSPSTLPERVWAVKKSKKPFGGMKDRQRKLREVEILRSLVNSDHVISFVDHWEDKGHLYIQTEYCEEGSLDVFLAQAGLKARLDDFRIWKILLEMSQGLKHIHDSGFIHLDIKPANVLVTFEGVLKIADFGMAAQWPAEKGMEGEGDREYIGPEILMGRYDKPADIFALGLIMFEIAGNVELPDNGLSWQKLRNGDISDVPSLTWSSETSIFRDASGNPMSEDSSFEELCRSDPACDDFGVDFLNSHKAQERKPVQLARSGELIEPPNFMIDASHPQALDKLVRWMISPKPQDRPTADQLLQAHGVQWAMDRRRAGATVFEGNWGPADDILSEDAEMIDV